MVAYLDEGGARYLVKKVLDRIQPVGSLYFSTTDTSPASLFGGTWERYAQGRVMVSASDTDTDFTVGKTGGSKTHRHDAGTMCALISMAGKSIVASRIAVQTYKGDVHTATPVYGGSFDASGQATRLSGNTGNSSSLNPYIAVYIWRRTA